MASSELEDLIARWFDGALDADEEARLDVLLSADPAAFERFKGLLGVEGLLRAREAAPDVLPGRVLETLRRRRFTDRVMGSIQARKATSHRLAWAVAAAAILLAVVAALAFRSSPPPAAPAEVRAPAPPKIVLPPLPEPKPALPEREPLKPLPAPVVEPEKTPPPAVPAPEPAVETPAPPAPPPPAPKPEPAPTRVERRALAILRGAAVAVDGETRRPVTDGAPIYAGEGLDVAAAASLEFDDGARIDLGSDTEIRELGEREAVRKPRGRRMSILRGVVAASVPKQPADQPLSFLSAQAEARVLGTSLRLTVEPGPKGRTALEVTEGKVRFIRTRDGKWIDVGPGLLATAGPDGDFAPRSALAEEIGLKARDAKLTGTEWRMVPDPRASEGWALEALKTPHKVTDFAETRMAYATFHFWARNDVDYCLWVRTHSQGTGDPWTRDFMTVQPLDAKLAPSSPFFGTAPTTGYVLTGLGATSQYAWVSGGVTDETKDAGPPVVRVRFNRTGFQTLRLFAVHPGIRVDTVWLSVAQTAKPAARALPPER